jgi:hypothetical protein
MEKTMLTLIATLLGMTAAAEITPPPRENKIYCYESEILPDAKESYFVEVKSQIGRAADFIIVGTASTSDSNNTKIELDQLIENTKGSIAEGRVILFATELAEDGYLNYLSIMYPWNEKKLNGLPSVYVGRKNGKQFSVPMTCTHMKK